MDRELHRIVSTCIIVKDGKYLILKRSPHKKVYPGKWTVPGGGLEVDDYINTPKTTKDVWYFALEKSLRREVKEETGLEVGDLKYLLDLTFIRPDDIPVITFSFWAEYEPQKGSLGNNQEQSGEVELDEDNVEYFWGTLEELKEYDLIEGIYDEIEMVDNLIGGKTINEE